MTHAKIDVELLAAGARAFDLDLSPAQLDQFARYADLLIDWNLRFNLTSIVDPRDIVIKHFLDSLSAIRSIPAGPIKLIDVGAGAGLPGLPIKLTRPEISLALLEATRKKCDFLRAVVADLRLAELDVRLLDCCRRLEPLVLQRRAGRREIPGRRQPEARTVGQLDERLLGRAPDRARAGASGEAGDDPIALYKRAYQAVTGRDHAAAISGFKDFLERLRMAKDKAEFDQFMSERRDRPAPEAPPPNA